MLCMLAIILQVVGLISKMQIYMGGVTSQRTTKCEEEQ